MTPRLLLANWPEGLSLAVTALSTLLPGMFLQHILPSHSPALLFTACLGNAAAGALSIMCACAVMSEGISFIQGLRRAISVIFSTCPLITMLVLFYTVTATLMQSLPDNGIFSFFHTYQAAAALALGIFVLLPGFVLIGILPYAWIYHSKEFNVEE